MTEQPDISAFLDGSAVEPYVAPTVDMEAITRLIEKYASLPPVEPIKLTREQLEELKTVVPVTHGREAAAMALTGVPVEMVEDVTDSTPFRLRVEKLKAAHEAAMFVPFPNLLGERKAR